MEITTNSTLRCIRISGRLDAITSSELELAITPLTATDKDIVIDMSDCRYLSSAGIRVLLQARKKLYSAQCDLFLAGVSMEIRKVLDIAGLGTTFRFEDHVEAALAHMGAGGTGKPGTTGFSIGDHQLIYHPVGDGKIEGTCFNTFSEIMLEKLGYAMGFGSILATDTGQSECRDLFVSLKKGVGFLPQDGSGDPDFRMITTPEKTTIPLCEAISFGHLPSGVLRLASPGLLTFGELNEAVDRVSANFFTPGSVTLRIVANFDKSAPSLNVFVANNEELTEFVRHAGLVKFEKYLEGRGGEAGFTGVKILLNHLVLPAEKMAPEEIMRNNLTFENLMAVKPFTVSSFLENPVAWLFNLTL